MQDLDHLPEIHFKHVFLQFDKELEVEFYDDFFRNSLWYIRIALFLCMILIAAFGILDIWIVPISKNYTWLIRYAILCPSIILCIIFTFFRFFKYIMQVTMCFECILVGLGFLVMIAIAKESEPGFKFYYVGLIQVIIAGHILLRLRFIHATIISWIIIIMYECVAIYFNGMLSTADKIPIFINNNFFFISTNIMGMIASFFIEYFIRNDFLLRKRIKFEEEQKVYKTRAELLKTRLERDYAQQVINSIEQETDAGFRNIAHSIKNKHMIQEVRNKTIRTKIKMLNSSIQQLSTNIPLVLDKACSTVLNKHKEKIFGYIQTKYPKVFKELEQNGNVYVSNLKTNIIDVFKNKNEQKINNFLLTKVIQNTKEVCHTLDDSFNNMQDILNYIYAIIAYQRGNAIRIIGNVFTELGRVYWHLSQTYRKELARYNISFKYDNYTGEDVHLRIYDFILEEDIIRNLFINSFRALVEDDSENKKTDKRIWIEVYLKTTDDKDQYYEVHLRDNGPGIEDVLKKEIFEGYSTKQPEFIVSGIRTEVEHGVGLATVKKRIEEAGGTIHEEGVYGQGADFVMKLKRYKDNLSEKTDYDFPIKESDVAGIQDNQNKSSLFAGKKLLVVDDDKIIAGGIGSIFADTGMQIMYAYTIDEARDKIYDRYITPDAIVLDLDLGKQRGETLLFELMGKDQNIPVVVVSGSDRVYDVPRLKNLSAHSVLPKPVDEEKLFLLMKEILLKNNGPAQSQQIPAVKEGVDTHKAKKILIIEDEKETREAIAYLFYGLRVEVAANKAVAIDKITTFYPDVITLDLGLGHDDGRDILKWMNNTGKKIPTVVVSGEIENDGDETAQELIALGALKTHKKPFNEDKLYADVMSILTIV
ncbi:MAG: response regulator [Spirochaetales bacterium]|nr:response regulator [Spirochaetales bacterium]